MLLLVLGEGGFLFFVCFSFKTFFTCLSVAFIYLEFCLLDAGATAALLLP